MKTTIITVCSTLLLTAVGVAAGCDAPNEPEDRAELLEDGALLELLESDDPESIAYALETLSEVASEPREAEPDASFDPADDFQLEVGQPMQSAACEDIEVYYDGYFAPFSTGYECIYAASGVGAGCGAACSDWAAAADKVYANEVDDNGTWWCAWSTHSWSGVC